MAIVRWEPFRELAALQNEMGRWMNQVMGGTGTALQPGNGGQGTATWLPAVDVWETDDELVLSFDLPGIPEDQISVELDDTVLTVSGQREREERETGDRFYRYERRFGTFQRSVTLPPGVNEDDIKATYRNGVLEVRVPKPEEQKPKRIQISTSEQKTIEGTGTRA
jgi:HSP20 family protein